MSPQHLTAVCPVCSERDFRIKYEKIKGVDTNRYNLIVCSGCGFGTVSPLPFTEALTHFYSAGYESRTKTNIYGHKNKEDFIQTNKSDIEDNLTLLSMLEPYRTVSHKRLLDVGCGHGFMCYAARLLGFDATGIDLDSDARRIGSAHLGVNIISGSIADIERRDFDVVTEIMTLEHVLNPAGHISEIRDKMNIGGLYLGSVPNFGGIYSRLRGRRWYHLIPPEHVNYFTIPSLRRLLQNCGFSVLYIGTIPLYAAPTICFGVRSRLNRLIAKQGNMVTKGLLTGLYRVLTLIKRYAVYKPLNFLILTLGLPGNGIFWIVRKDHEKK